MNEVATIAPVRKTLTVNCSPERAFQVFANGRPGKSMNCFLQRLQVRRGHQDCRRVSMAGDLGDLVRLVGFLHQSGKFVLGFAERHRSRSTFIARKQARL